MTKKTKRDVFFKKRIALHFSIFLCLFFMREILHSPTNLSYTHLGHTNLDHTHFTFTSLNISVFGAVWVEILCLTYLENLTQASVQLRNIKRLL